MGFEANDLQSRFSDMKKRRGKARRKLKEEKTRHSAKICEDMEMNEESAKKVAHFNLDTAMTSLQGSKLICIIGNA